MNKRRLVFITGIIFLVQMVSLNCMSLAQDTALNPPSLVSVNYFKEVYAVISLAFSIYKFDAIDGNAKSRKQRLQVLSQNHARLALEIVRAARNQLIPRTDAAEYLVQLVEKTGSWEDVERNFFAHCTNPGNL